MRILRNVLDTKTKTVTWSDSADGREGRDVTEARGTIEVYFNITAVSGTTPSMTPQVDDGFYIEEAEGVQAASSGSVYRASILSSPTPITTTGLFLVGSLADYGTLLRFSGTISGTTPSFTFEIWLVYEAAD